MTYKATARANLIDVEVAYATPEKQELISLRVSQGTTALDAVVQSKIAEVFPEIDVESAPMGIFSAVLNGKQRPLPRNYVLRQHDRVEIYRPLIIDPKQARLARAAKKRA